MSFEFEAMGSDLLKVLTTERLARLVAEAGPYEVLTVEDHQFTIRYTDAERQSSWPEDAAIYVKDDSILAALHGGTKEQGSALIRALTDIYGTLGVDLSFEEL